MAAPFLATPADGPALTVSGGVASYPDDARSAPELLAAADAAVAAVKRLGGGAVGAGGADDEERLLARITEAP